MYADICYVMLGSCYWGTMVTTHHLLHTVPVDQSVWVREVGLVVLLIGHHKLAAVAKRAREEQ